MPYQKLLFRPGINSQKTPLLNEGGWSSGNCVRFREGIPEVLGGWVTLGVGTLVGVPRGAHAWASLAGIPLLAVGTNVRLYVIQSLSFTTPTNPFTTVHNSHFVTVADSNAPPGLVPGVQIQILNAAAVGGITLTGNYLIKSVISSTSYTVASPFIASSSATGGGTPQIIYPSSSPTIHDVIPLTATNPTNPFVTTMGSSIVEVSIALAPSNLTIGTLIVVTGASPVGGVDPNTPGGYQVIAIEVTVFTVDMFQVATSSATGGGTPTVSYGLSGPISTGTSLSPAGPPVAMTWTLDNFGEFLIACPFGNGIYLWEPESPAAHATIISMNAPAQVNAIFVSNGAEQIVALGSIPASGGAFDPMLVSWCNSGDYTTWLAAANNDAGDFALTDGSQLLWGGRAAQQNLIWSDTALFSMQFIGGLLIYSFNQLGTACGLIGPKAAGIVNGVAFWMSKLNFMMYNGTVQVLDCTVWDLVFKNLNVNQSFKINCGINSQFNEVRWDYPSASGSGENDSFVIFNYVENTWTFGSDAQSSGVEVARTAWQDVSPFGYPVGFDSAGNSWFHEQENIYSAGTSDMPWSIESGYSDIAGGEEMMFVDQVLPDQILSGGTVDVTLLAQRYSADTPVTVEGAITTATEVLPMRIRGRQIAVEFANGGGALNQFWRLGSVRIRAAQDGRD